MSQLVIFSSLARLDYTKACLMLVGGKNESKMSKVWDDLGNGILDLWRHRGNSKDGLWSSW